MKHIRCDYEFDLEAIRIKTQQQGLRDWPKAGASGIIDLGEGPFDIYIKGRNANVHLADIKSLKIHGE